jgi:acyl-coenzyme A thioesterase PaaI-like protein
MAHHLLALKFDVRVITPTIPQSGPTVLGGAPGRLKDFHTGCFACGIGNHSGLNLHFDVGADGVAAASWQPSAEFRSYPDRVHGGVIATLLDSAIVHTLFARGVAGVTAEISIRYLRSIEVRCPVHVRGWVESQRLGIYLCGAEARQSGTIAVRATAKFMALPVPSSGFTDSDDQP